MNLAFSTSVLAFSAFLSSYSSWDKAEITGPALVLIGIIWEFKLLLSKLPNDSTRELIDRKHVKEILAALIVVLGVAVELVVVPHTLLEVGVLKQNTEELRSKNNELEAKIALMKQRAITPEQREAFISFLKGSKSKCPVDVYILEQSEKDFETVNYASQIRSILDEAGYKAESGIVKTFKYPLYAPIQFTNHFPLMFVYYGSGSNTTVFNAQIIIKNDNTVAIGSYRGTCIGDVVRAFDAIGTKPGAAIRNDWFLTKSNEWAIFVPPKL